MTGLVRAAAAPAVADDRAQRAGGDDEDERQLIAGGGGGGVEGGLAGITASPATSSMIDGYASAGACSATPNASPPVTACRTPVTTTTTATIRMSRRTRRDGSGTRARGSAACPGLGVVRRVT
jgi:hypothetical protein